MQHNRWIFIILLAFAGIVHADEINDGWGVAASWLGKPPSASIAKGAPSLLAQPPIKNALKTILPKAEAASLAKFSVEIPVRQIDEFLVVNKCRPHNCPADMATVVIDVKNKRLWVGFFSREEARVATRWYGMSDDYSVLPESVKADFASRHGD